MIKNFEGSFSISLLNEQGEEIEIGYDKKNNQYFIDRIRSGKTDFQKDFAARHTASRFAVSPKMTLSLLIDVSSVELFADGGLTVMTAVFFPNLPFNKMTLQSTNSTFIKSLEYYTIRE